MLRAGAYRRHIENRIRAGNTAPSTGHRAATAPAGPTTAATASANRPGRRRDHRVHPDLDQQPGEQHTRTRPARPANRRSQPRTVPTGRPNPAAIRRTPNPGPSRPAPPRSPRPDPPAAPARPPAAAHASPGSPRTAPASWRLGRRVWRRVGQGFGVFVSDRVCHQGKPWRVSASAGNSLGASAGRDECVAGAT